MALPAWTPPTSMTKRYHFSLGNSSKGPVGFCASIVAESANEAVERLKRSMPMEVQAEHAGALALDEYIEIYLNPARITVNDIDEVEDV